MKKAKCSECGVEIEVPDDKDEHNWDDWQWFICPECWSLNY